MVVHTFIFLPPALIFAPALKGAKAVCQNTCCLCRAKREKDKQKKKEIGQDTKGRYEGCQRKEIQIWVFRYEGRRGEKEKGRNDKRNMQEGLAGKGWK